MTFELNNYDPFFDLFYPLEKRSRYNNTYSMRTDVEEAENDYIMNIEMPGVKKEDINITLEDGYLTVSVAREEKEEKNYVRFERSYGTASRSFYVGLKDEKNIKAFYVDGVLTLTFPKNEEKDAARKIAIN